MAAGAMSVGGGMMANRGRAQQAQLDRNFQRQEAATNRSYQTEESGRQMAFQERMRNSEWQSGVADMQAAGINPAVAYSQGGATAPMGARGSGAAGSGSRADQQDVITPGVTSALQYQRAKAEIKGIQATMRKTDAEAAAVRSRPGRILEPAVDLGTRSMNDLFSNRTRGILGYEMGSSVKQVIAASRRMIEELRTKFRANWEIGPDRTPRRR